MRQVLLAGFAAILMLALCSAPAFAVDNHVFDPVLSLRGDGLIDATDKVPDPGSAHPPLKLDGPCGVATDKAGSIYVASGAVQAAKGINGRVDIFSPSGIFLTEIVSENQPCSLAVDSKGNLFVHEYQSKMVVVYEPDSYPPDSTTKYGPRTVVYDPNEHGNPGSELCLNSDSVAVDPSNDHLYIAFRCRVFEYGPTPSLGDPPLQDDIGQGLGFEFKGMDVYGQNQDVYVSGVTSETNKPELPENARVFVFDGTDGHKKLELDGSNMPDGAFSFTFGQAGIAVDQLNGDVYVDDTETHDAVVQFDSSGEFIGGLEHSLSTPQPFADIAIDAPMVQGEAGYTSPNEGHVYVTSGANAGKGHLYAFEPRFVGPPLIKDQAATQITETEAMLEADLNPNALPTSYHFELVTAADFLVNGYANAIDVPAVDSDAGEGGSFITVSEPATGLVPGAEYRFRLSASNEECITRGEGKPCDDGGDASFATYSHEAGLPDARAYELVTPPNTNGRTPTIRELGLGLNGFVTPMASPDGNSVVFGTEGGALPETEGGGYHDIYRALRGDAGWQTQFSGLSGAQAAEPYPGGFSADHLCSFWEVRGKNGSLVVPGAAVGANYLRCSDGSIGLIGLGSEGTEPYAQGKWIAPGRQHVVFATENNNGAPANRLELEAPPTGTNAIYDRTPDGVTHVVSLLPEDKTPTASAVYQGASADGSSVAFTLTEAGVRKLFVRSENEETIEVESGGMVFGGLSEDGSQLVYVLPKETPKPGEPPVGNIFTFDLDTREKTAVGSGNESVLVNVSADGSAVYFVSPQQLDGSAGVPGEDNLYAWDGSSPRFIATLLPEDVAGDDLGGGVRFGGLGLWTTYAVNPSPNPEIGPASDPSRTTPDGDVLVFESHSDLTEYESNGHSQIFRYDMEDESITCLSCNPTGAPSVSDAQLQSQTPEQFHFDAPVNALTRIANVTSDGKTVFFQSADPLTAGDMDGKVDVYEWQEDGSGGCETATGCVHLISSGQSHGDDHLYAMTPDGSDVFFESGDLLVPQDIDETPSIYDARVGGGFAMTPSGGDCTGDACQGPSATPPSLPGMGGSNSATNQSSGNVKKTRSCPKGKRKVRRKGKVRCVKRVKGKGSSKRTRVVGGRGR